MTLHLSAQDNKQTPPAPQKPWLDYWREETVALGVPDDVQMEDKAIKKAFRIVGTGVLFGGTVTPHSPWLVTAKHVLENPDENWAPEEIYLRFSWFENRPVDQYFGIKIKLRADGKALWHSIPDTDLACLDLRIPLADAGRATVNTVSLDTLATKEDIFESAHVMVLGYPGAIGPAFWSRSLLRQGIIAWVSPEDPENSRLIIDCNVFPGNSGGPVFKVPTGVDRFGKMVNGGPLRFLGIVSEGRKEFGRVDMDGRPFEPRSPDGRAHPILSSSWIGVGVVEPAAKVKRLILEAEKK